ncbi:MAG TPA: CPBP family intramembrane glutamic endopeptidase [Natrialbaceae archaeon]|nr:CPBP family intramembrane glutamic endopeptidase [Natrialbaceae archaeon]
MTLPLTIVGLVIALGGFEARSRLMESLDRPDDGLEPHRWKWLVPAAVVGYVLLVEGQGLASIGWRVGGPVPFVGWVIGGLVVMLGANVVLQPLWARLGTGEDLAAGVAEFADFSISERLFVAGTAGVTEEIPYRGYTIERVATLTGSPLLGAAISLVAFLAAHVGDTWSREAALQMAQPTVILLALYLWTRSLPVVILVHAANDAVGLLFADRMADRADADPA